jgi:hypothetical protein
MTHFRPHRFAYSNYPRRRCRYATFGALPTLSVRDRAIIVLNIGFGDEDMLLALHRQATRSHRPSIAGTAMPLAAAPYRASGLVH